MAKIIKGRIAAEVPESGAVVFLIGMRINQVWAVWKWLPVFIAMPRMLIELMKNPELGLVGYPRTFVSGRLIMVWQQWSSFEKLEQYSKSQENNHLPAWKAFNKSARNNSSVGIFHETYLLGPNTAEGMYVNTPALGLAKAFGEVPAEGSMQTARKRLGL
jgi:hypothetical protein